MATAGQPMKKNLKLPLEIMQQLGAFSEVAKMIKEEMKDIAQHLRQREKEVKAAGDDPEMDAGIREGRRRQALLEQQAEENKKKREAHDKSVMDGINSLENKLASTPFIDGIARKVMAQFSGGPLASYMNRAAGYGEKLGAWALSAAERGLISPSLALEVSGAATTAIATLGPLALIAGAGYGAQQLSMSRFSGEQGAARASARMAQDVLNLVNQGMDPNSLSASYVAETLLGAESWRKTARAEALSGDPWGRALSRIPAWMGGGQPQSATQAEEEANKKQLTLAMASRKFGMEWMENKSPTALRTEADYNERYRKIFAERHGVGLGALFSSTWDAIKNFDITHAGREIDIATIEYMQQQRLSQSTIEMERIVQIGGRDGPELRQLRHAEQKARSVWLDARVSREYMTNQQWNQF